METNKIYCGDNLQIMRELPENSVDLIYLDPPFFSGRNYEVIWGDKAEVRSFEDRWGGEITHYTNWMVKRLIEMHRILKPTGSIYLHCDWHASHYLKVEMDKIFGYNNFRNEIVWCYTQGGRPKDKFANKHDIIFLYGKTKNVVFNSDNIKIPYELTSEKSSSSFTKIDENGKRYKEIYGSDKKKKYKYFFDDGKTPYDWWTDIHQMTGRTASSGNESLGYPTQKPEALLERIIKASSNEGDIVLDPFCGCGTSTAVAMKLNRKFIGIDISTKSVDVISSRLKKINIDYRLNINIKVEGLPTKIEDLKKMKHWEFQQWVCDKMIAKNTSPNPQQHSGIDGGVDGIIQSTLFTGKYVGCPIQVKQSDSVGVNPIRNFYAIMTTDMKKSKGFIIALSFGSGAVEQVAKYKKDHNVDIKLIKAEDLCNIQHYDYGVKIVNSEDI